MRDLTQGNMYKSFAAFSIPAIIASMVTQMYTIINTIIAGKFLGEAGIAAIGATSPLLTLISCSFAGYEIGMSLYVAKLFGVGDYNKIRECILNSCITIGVIGFIICSLLAAFSDSIITLLQVDAAIHDAAKQYFTIYILGYIIITFNQVYTYLFQAFGNTKYQLAMSVISMVINICANILSVTVFRAGVSGIAVSTVLTALLIDILYAIRLRKYFKELCTNKGFRLNFGQMREILNTSVPMMLQQLVMYLSDTMVSPLINSLGGSATSAYSVSQRVKVFADQTYQNSSKAVSNYASRSIGAKKTKHIKYSVKVGFILGELFFIPFLIVFALAAEPLCSIFYPSGYGGEGLTYSVIFIKYYMPFSFINVINNLFHSFFRGIKAGRYLLLVTIVGSASKYILTLLLFGRMGLNGVYLAVVLSWLIEAVVCLGIYFRGKWEDIVKAQL